MTTIEVEDPATEAAYSVYRRYRPWVGMGALQQAAGRVAEQTEAPHRGQLRRAAEQVARRAKAAKCGYRWEDEVFYSLGLIGRLLPYALDRAATPPPTLADSSEINRNHAGKLDGYGGWEAAIADVRRATEALSGRQRALLVMSYQAGYGVDWLSQRLGRSAEHLNGEIRKAMRRIQRFLGGRNPHQEL